MIRVSHKIKNCLLLCWGIFVICTLFLSGCTSAPKKFDYNYSGPQVLVKPETIKLSVSRLMKSDLKFTGKGFEPGDSVYISLMDVNISGKQTDIPVAFGAIDENGFFKAIVEDTIKITELMRAQISVNDDMEPIIIIKQPPIPEKQYTVRVFSMENDENQAECLLTIKGPSLTDRFKDWIGVRLGKIQR